MPCRVPKRRFSCGAPQHLTKNRNRPPDGVTEADRSAFLHQTYHHHRETAKGNPHPNKVWMGIPFFSKKKTAANATVF